MKSFLASLLLVTLLGCDSVARITLRDSTSIEGEIVSSSNHSVYVETDEGEEDVRRQEIRDIDHPGNVAATLGGILMGYGALNTMLGLRPECPATATATWTSTTTLRCLSG